MLTQPGLPEDRIDDLIQRLADPSPADDPVTLSAELGIAWLELYERDGEDDALQSGLDCLRHTLGQAPDHPERNRWVHGIGLGFAERARRRASMQDHHEAIDWLSRLYAEAPWDCPQRPRAAIVLGELCWARYWLTRFRPDPDTERALAEVDQLLRRVGPLLAAPLDPDDLPDIRLVAGFAQLERWELTGERIHLDRGVDLLAAASIWDLAPDDVRRCQAGSELVEALRQQALLDGDPEPLDRAIAMAVRIIELSGPADELAWLLLHRYAASAAYERWRGHRDRADITLAYRGWQPLREFEMDPASTREYQAVLAAYRAR